MSSAIVGVDVGGTFTDFALIDEGGITVLKIPSTREEPSGAVLSGLKHLQVPAGTNVAHGSTVATNALLERRGARTALLVTEGFEDILEIGRQDRPALYDFGVERPSQLVPPDLRLGVKERLDSQGEAIVSLSTEEARHIARRVRESAAEAVAVSLLFSFRNPGHERMLLEALRDLECPAFLSVSSDLLPEYREYERTSTVVVNAYVGPVMARYLQGLADDVGPRLRIVHSGGGSLSAEQAAQQPVRTLLSGPAGGVMGAYRLASQAGYSQAITLDMGGTSTDVSLCPGRVQETTSSRVAGYPTLMPAIDIRTVGAGGGSIARVDSGGALQVGPQSAGAEPGPACYGRGEYVTVTDANLVLGRLDAERFLDGRMPLDVERARFCMDRLARELGKDVASTAEGIIRVANAAMERALRAISMERGFDPRRFTLVAFGGAGPMHACSLAEGLGVTRILVPPQPGILSAMGAAMADVVKDYSRTLLLQAAEVSSEMLQSAFRPLEEQARRDLGSEGFRGSSLVLRRFLDVRYVGQSYELTVACPPSNASASRATANRFHRAHRQRYGHADRSQPVEVVTARLKATGVVDKPVVSPVDDRGGDPSMALVDERPVVFDGEVLPTRCYDRSLLISGNAIQGPGLVFQMDSTTVISPGWTARVDGYGNMILESAQV